MKKLTMHLWYDKEAREAVEFYTTLFENSKITRVMKIEDTPSGDAESISFELAGQPFMAISAGPYFKLNPSISLMVACGTVEEIDAKWEALSEGGTELMPLGEYPFCPRYGWIQDRFGLSWQLLLQDDTCNPQKITPCFLFTREQCGRAEPAVEFYTKVFPNSSIGMINRYSEDEPHQPEAKVNYLAFQLDGMNFVAMDHGYGGDFSFNEAFSLIVPCKDQGEIDYFWEKLSAVPEKEQCGWLQDAYGVSWQIIPYNWVEAFMSGTKEETQRVFKAMMDMKKMNIEQLMKAKAGE